MKTFQKDKLTVEIYENRTLMGEAAGIKVCVKQVVKVIKNEDY